MPLIEGKATGCEYVRQDEAVLQKDSKNFFNEQRKALSSSKKLYQSNAHINIIKQDAILGLSD